VQGSELSGEEFCSAGVSPRNQKGLNSGKEVKRTEGPIGRGQDARPTAGEMPRYIRRADLAAKAAGEELWHICGACEDVSFPGPRDAARKRRRPRAGAT
jgi:hypothetical protein